MKFFKKHYKYFVAALIFLVVLFFSNPYNPRERFKTSRNIKRIEKEIEFYQNEIEDYSERINKIEADTQTLEKYARENFLFKKENEEIFIIMDDEN